MDVPGPLLPFPPELSLPIGFVSASSQRVNAFFSRFVG
jgi:hypothetical protein